MEEKPESPTRTPCRPSFWRLRKQEILLPTWSNRSIGCRSDNISAPGERCNAGRGLTNHLP
jgi:hypothetical protein